VSDNLLELGDVTFKNTLAYGDVTFRNTLALGAIATELADSANWSPAEITTWAWWDPSDSSNRTVVSSKLEGLADKSGNGRDLVIADNDASNYLELETFNSIESMDSVEPDPLASQPTSKLRLASSGPADCSVFLVLRDDTEDGTYIVGNDGGGSNYFGLHQGGGASATVDAGMGSPTYRINATALSTPTRGDLHAAVRASGSTGAIEEVANLDLSGIPAIVPFWFSNSLFRFAGSWGERIVVETSEITADVRQRIEGYLAHKWGLTSELPGGHPYKTSAP